MTHTAPLWRAVTRSGSGIVGGMSEDLRQATRLWYESCPGAFEALKSRYGLDDTWQFSIGRPDVMDPNDLTDPRGAAAFMLRRMQAVYYLLSEPFNSTVANQLCGYVADIATYLTNVMGAEGPVTEEDGVLQVHRHHCRTLLEIIVGRTQIR